MVKAGDLVQRGVHGNRDSRMHVNSKIERALEAAPQKGTANISDAICRNRWLEVNFGYLLVGEDVSRA